MFYKIAELSIKPAKSAIQNSGVFVAQPNIEKEKLAGKLFIVIEIDSKSKESEKIISFLMHEINNSYYQNEKILFREKIHTIKVEHIFEASLTRVNKNFSNFISKEKLNINIDKINISAGIIYGDDVHFANSGKNKILLIHKTTKAHNNDGKSNYRISDITKQSGPSPQYNNLKLFSNVISGKIPRRGSFIISNEALMEYVSNKQLIDIASTLPPASALEQIRQILAKTNFHISFNAIFLKNTTQEKSEKNDINIKYSAQESITNLNKTEDKTENLLSASGIINIKKWLKIPNIFSSKTKKLSQLNNSNLKNKILSKKNISFLQNVKFLPRKIFAFTVKIFPTIIISLLREKKFGQKSPVSKFKKLSIKRKLLISIFCIFLLLFIYNISSTKIEEIKVQKQIDYTSLVNEIEQKQNKAEANLLYSNEEGAKTLFKEIEDLIKNFPQDTDKQIEEFEDYREILKQNLEKIQKISRFDNLDELANFRNLNQNANPENIIFSSFDKNIYAIDSTQKAIYSLDTKNNSATLATNIENQFNKLKSPTITSNNSIYYFDNNKIFEYNIDGSSNMLAAELNGDYLESQSMIDVYNDRLYILNTKENNIHRHNRLSSGFGPAYNWANKNIDLSNSVDISIDGNVYILKKSGEIVRLLRGEKTDWKIEIIEPPLTNPNKLIVSPENNFIYILENDTNRIVVFDKEGQFMAQYTSNSFTNLIDFTINEEDKKIYVLNDSSVFAMSTTHTSEEAGN